jgi:Protein of unknown function (DUF2478)
VAPEFKSAPLAAIQYQRGFDINELLSRSCAQLRSAGVRIGGVLQQSSGEQGHCASSVHIVDLRSGQTFNIWEDRGPARSAAASTNVGRRSRPAWRFSQRCFRPTTKPGTPFTAVVRMIWCLRCKKSSIGCSPRPRDRRLICLRVRRLQFRTPRGGRAPIVFFE